MDTKSGKCRHLACSMDIILSKFAVLEAGSGMASSATSSSQSKMTQSVCMMGRVRMVLSEQNSRTFKDISRTTHQNSRTFLMGTNESFHMHIKHLLPLLLTNVGETLVLIQIDKQIGNLSDSVEFPMCTCVSKLAKQKL